MSSQILSKVYYTGNIGCVLQVAQKCKVQSQVRFSIEVVVDFKWTVRIGSSIRLQLNSGPLLDLPQTLNTLNQLRRVTERMESFKICTGNENEKYFPLQAARKGMLDSTGNGCGKFTVYY